MASIEALKFEAQKLRDSGASLRSIADTLGMKKSWVGRWTVRRDEDLPPRPPRMRPPMVKTPKALKKLSAYPNPEKLATAAVLYRVGQSDDRVADALRIPRVRFHEMLAVGRAQIENSNSVLTDERRLAELSRDAQDALLPLAFQVVEHAMRAGMEPGAAPSVVGHGVRAAGLVLKASLPETFNAAAAQVAPPKTGASGGERTEALLEQIVGAKDE